MRKHRRSNVIYYTTKKHINNNHVQQTRFTASFPGQPGWAGFSWSKRRLDDSRISWTICKSFAPGSRQTIKVAPHHFTCHMLFLMPYQQCQTKFGTVYYCICHRRNICYLSVNMFCCFKIMRFWLMAVLENLRFLSPKVFRGWGKIKSRFSALTPHHICMQILWWSVKWWLRYIV